MASLYSTATLGLRLDTTSFNSALQAAGRMSNSVFDGLAAGANQFKDAWDDATRGIKDTKRIISGILISQGFYGIMNGLTDAGSAALTFSANMETAAVSMEYFMQGTDKAAKALAYLREINDFAARTPFTTEAALELSKYVQAVGIGTQYTKSFLTVVTDAAAATGATTENLERVVFALGQMKTKGRIANEEIRQLANANIPIYEILQEELGLTGEQISNIGKYWVDADKAIVAILTGLDKRYGGAADRIANTVTGMLDTIKDDALIIAQEAGSDIYDEFSGTLTKIRDKLDEYRDVATEMGGFGLLNHIMLDIDPTGEFGTELLVLVGNVQQLMSALKDLYISSQPVVKLFGKGLYSGINTATIIMTAFSRTIESTEKALEKMGITSGTLGTTLGKLYVMYQAGKWALTLGQGAAAAGQSMYQLSSSIVGSLVPAMNAGSVSAAGLLGNLLALAAVAAGVYALISGFNSFAGLDVTTGDVFPTDYEAAMNDYLAAMDEYNAQIAQYQSQFNSPFTEMTDGSEAAIEALDDTAKASKKAAGSVKNDWVAAFDEVYQVPTDKGGGGSGAETKLPDLGKLISPPKFKFPSVALELKKPELEDFFDGALLDDTTLNQDWFKGVLPGLILAGILGAAAHFKKPGNIDIDAGKGPKDVSALKDAETRKLAKQLVDELESIKKQAKLQADELRKALEDNRVLNKSLEGGTTDYKLLQDTMKKLDATIEKRAALTGGAVKAMPITSDIKQLRSDVNDVLNQFRLARTNELKKLIEGGMLRGQALTDAQAELKKISKGITSFDILIDGATAATTATLKQAFNDIASTIYKAFEQLDTSRLSSGLVSGEQSDLIKLISSSAQNLLYAGDELTRRAVLVPGAGASEAQRLYDRFELIRKDLNNLEHKGVKIISELGAANDAVDKMSKELRGTLSSNIISLQTESAKTRAMLGSLQGEVAKMSDAAMKRLVAERDATTARNAAERDAVKRAQDAAQAAQAQAERSRIAAMRAGESTSSRFLTGDEAARIGDNIIDALTEQEAADLPDVFDAATNLDTAIQQIRGLADAARNLEPINIDEDSLTLSDIRKYLTDYQKQTQARSLPAALRDAIDYALEQGGINEDDERSFMRIFAKNGTDVDAVQMLSKALRDAVGFNNSSGLSKHPVGSTVGAITSNDASKLSFGLGSFEGGLGDIYARSLAAVNPNFIDAIERSANAEIEIAAEIGRYTQNLNRMAARMKWGASGAELSMGGYRWNDGMLLQVDGQLRLIRDAVQRTIPTIITSMAQHNVEALTAGARYIGKANDTVIRSLPGSVLRGINPEVYASMGYQVSALHAQAGNSGALSVLNRDFVLTVDKHAEALSRFTNAFKGAALHAPKNAAPFSLDNIDTFTNMLPSLKSADAATKVNAYMRRVILPTFGIPEYDIAGFESAISGGVDYATTAKQLTGLINKFDFTTFSDFIETFVVDYTADQLKALNSKGNIAAVKQINELIAEAANFDGVADALGSFIKFSDNLTTIGGQVALINTNSSWRQIGKISKSTKGFVDNILKIQSSLDGYLSTKFRNIVDSAIAEYQFDIARAGTPEKAARVTQFFKDRLDGFANSLRSYVDGSADVLLRGSTMTKGSMETVAEALNTLAANPPAVDKIPMLVRSVVDNTNRLNAAIESNARATDITKKAIRQLANDSEALLNTLGSISDSGINEYFEKLTAMSDRITRALNDGEDITLKQFGTINQLVTPLGAADSAAYYRDIISGSDAFKYSPAALPRPETVPVKYIVDTETTGLIKYSAAGVDVPKTLQVASLNAETGEVSTFYITRGIANDIKGLNGIKQIEDVGDAWRNVTLEQFQAGAIPESQVNALLKQLIGDAGVSGYNAVNVNRLGGGYDFKVIADNFDFKLNAATDVMTRAADVFERTLGTRSTFKLSELVEIIAGATPTGAHEAGADVKMTQFALRNIENGRLEEVIRMAMLNGITKGGFKESLREAAQQLNKMNRLPDNLLGSSGLRIDFDIPNLPKNAATIAAQPIPAVIRQPALPAYVPEVDSRVISETISEIFEPVTEAGKLAGESAAAAKAAGSNDNIYSLIKQFFSSRFGSGNWDAFKDNFNTFREKVTNPFSNLKANAAGKGVTLSIDEAYKQLFAASEDLNLPNLRKSWVQAQRDLTNGVIDKSLYNSVKSEYEAALASYQNEAKTFFRTVTDQLSGAVEGFKAPADFVTTISAFGDTSDKFIAMLVDPKTGVPALISDSLYTSGTEIYQAAQRFATNQLKAAGEIAADSITSYDKIAAAISRIGSDFTVDDVAKLIDSADDATKKLISAFGEISEVTHGTRDIDALSDMAKKLYKAMSDFGSRVVITDAKAATYTLNELGEAVTRLEEIRWAGNAAKEGIETAADTVGTAFRSFGSRLVNGVANFGILDVAAAAIQGGIQHINDTAYKQYMQSSVSVTAADVGANILASNGYDIGSVLGDEVFHGALQEFSFGIANGLASSLTITAVTPIVTSAISAKLGGAIGSIAGPIGTAVGIGVGVLAGVLTDKAIEAMGGHTATNLYLDDYLNALDNGSLITTSHLEDMAAALGMSAEEIASFNGNVGALTDALKSRYSVDVEAIEDRIKAQTTAITMGSANYNNALERDDINRLLYGRSDSAKRDFTSSNTKDDLSLRLIAGLGLIDGITTDTFGLGYRGATSNDFVTTVRQDAVVRDETTGKLIISDPETHARLEELLGVNVEIRNLQSTVGEKVRFGLYNADTGEAFTAGMSDAGDLAEVLRLAYEQGNTSSDIAKALDIVLADNNALRQEIESRGGIAYEMLGLVRDNLDGYIALYNAAAGTEYTRNDVNQNYQIGEAIMSWASKIVEDAVNQATAQMALSRVHSEGFNTALLSEGAERIVWGGSLDGLDSSLIEALNEVGVHLTEYSIGIGNTLTEAYEQAYLMLTTSAETLAEHIAGFTLNPGNVDLEGLSISAQDAEILAQAGIQINNDGTITFMNPRDDGSTGATRDLTLGSSAVSQNIKDKLEENGIYIDYSKDKGNVTLDKTAVTQKNLYGAMFAMPSGWDRKASKEIKAAFSKIGTVMDSGYVMITNKAILSGEKTVEGFMEGFIDSGDISEDIRKYFKNFDEVFTGTGDELLNNIRGWSDAVVIPSFISADKLTPEIESAFAAAGITFTEYGDEFLMVINEFGDNLSEWATRIDAETWNKLDIDVQKALKKMGVDWTQVGNQVMVDLKGAFENGAQEAVTVFLDNPELWDQIPEEFQELFGDLLFKTDDGFLALKNAGSAGLVNINGVWVTDMKNIRDDMIRELAAVNPKAATELDNLRQAFSDGLFKIEGVFDEHDLPQLAEDEIVIPFRDLPDEIQNSLTGPGGLSGNLDSALVVVKGVAHTGFQNIVAEAESGAAGVGEAANTLVGNITEAVVQAQLKIKELERLQNSANKKGGTIDVTNTYQGTLNNGSTTTVYAWNNSAGVQVGWYWYDEKGRVQYHKGLDKGATGFDYAPGGTTLVGELGREMAILPDGSVRMLGANGKGELVDLPKGTQVLTNEDTEEVLKYTGGLSSVRKLAEGNTELIVTEGEAEDNPEEDNFREIFLAFMKAFIAKYGSTVDDSDTDITAENYDSIDSAAHFVAESHAVAIRGYSAALFEILESWRNDKSGLEALGNKLDASIIDNSVLIVDAVQKADEDIVDAIRNISLRSEHTSSYSSDYDYDFGEFDSSHLGLTWNDPDDDEPYNWLADVIQAQEMWANATTDAEREAAHVFAEAARATQGFSGGADGSQFIATGGAQADWVKEVFAAKQQYALATSDEERIAAHNRAEAARATQGFTGGITGSSFALTDSLENIIAAMRSVQDNTDKTEENITTLNNDLETEIAEAMSKWSAQDLSTAELTNSTIIAGCDEVANAVGSYVSWSQSEINSLKSELSSMQMAASQAERSSSSVSGSIKGSAKGSLVTEDALYRAGELGLNEAIIPLEQPSVMAMVGSAIADSMPEEDAAIILNNEQGVIAALTEQTETLAVAIRGAVAAIAENQVNYKDVVVATVERIIDTVNNDLKALDALETLGNLGTDLNALNESVMTVGELLEAANVSIAAILENKATSTDISMIPSALSAEFGQWWTSALAEARSMYNTATDDAGRTEAHARAEDLRALLGYSGGVDGSQVIPLQRTGYSYSVDTTAEILEQFQSSLTELTQAEWNDETVRDKEETEMQSNDMRSLTTVTTDGIGTLSTMLQTTGSSIISAIGSGASMVASAVGSYVSWSQSTISSLQSELSSMKMAASQAERGSTSLSGIRGSASGSLVTEDALYRAGEGGLNEAIIPLEKPNVMELVGSTIARYMPDSATVIMSDEESTVAAIIEQTETIVVAIRGAVAAVLEGMGEQNLLLSSLNSVMMGNVSSSASKITSAVSSSKYSGSSSLGSGWDTGPDSLLAREAAAGTLRNAWPDYDGDLPLFGGGTSAGTKAQKYIDAGVNYSDSISTSVAKLAAAASAGPNVKKSITVKGSARGSLITRDAFYRAGELGLNEAIIPLERPDVLTQVGAAIADFMPVEQRYAMGAALGMTNGGISPMGAPVVREDPSMMASAITQSVLESVLPAMASMQGDDVSDRRPLYVGTLVADERGLQALERKLYDIRKMEATRR